MILRDFHGSVKGDSFSFGQGVKYSDSFPQLTKLLSAKEAAGNRHAWWLKFDWIGRCGEGMLDVSTDSVRFWMPQGQDGIANLMFCLVDKHN